MKSKNKILNLDSIQDNILQIDQNTPKQTKRIKTHNKLSKSRLPNKDRRSSKSKENESDLEEVSGFESIVLNTKKVYYKKIKKMNRDKMKKEIHRKRIEVLIKFILYVF